MRTNNIDSYMDYARFLKDNDEEYRKLLDVLTVNVTEFFRDPSVFKAFGEKFLPTIIECKEAQGRRVIRIWSAGCASGEEAYSIAIVLKEFLGEKADNFIITIHATDIDEKNLEKAERGQYDDGRLKNVGARLLRKYFERDGKYRVKEEIKKFVRFKKLDLLSAKPFACLDAIFCRNVLIYLKRETQKKIFTNFHNALVMDGYLIIGKAEMMVEELREKFELVDLDNRIYKKI